MKMKVLAGLVLASLFTVGCTPVDVGYEGIIVNKLGTDKGVDQESVGVGRYFLTWNEDLYTFPVFTQTKVWTDDSREGSQLSEEFNITTKDGGTFQLDIGVNYKVLSGQSPKVFQKWRVSIDTVTNTHVRRLVQDQFTKFGSQYTAFDVMSKRTEIVNAVEANVKGYLVNYGIDVENVFLIGIEAPEVIKLAMERKMEAVEKTAQRQQEVEQSKAEAAKLIASAEGKAQAIEIEGKALLANPMVLDARKIEKWDGVLPNVVGSNEVMFNLGEVK